MTRASLLVVALLAISSCDWYQEPTRTEISSGPFSGREITLNAPPPHEVSIEVDRKFYDPGDNITATVRNLSSYSFRYNHCCFRPVMTFQRLENGKWVHAPGGLSVSCSCDCVAEAFLEPEAEATSTIEDCGSEFDFRGGIYRLTFYYRSDDSTWVGNTAEDPLTAGVAYSEPFGIRQ